MSEQQIHHDIFEQYLFKRIIPFIAKYRYLLSGTFAALIIIFIVIGIYSVYSKEQENTVLNDIYTTLSAKKEITADVLEELNKKYPEHRASLEIKWLLAGKYSERDDFDNAIRIYNEIIELAPESGLALYSMLSLASCFEQKGQYADAIKTYDTCLATFDQSGEIRIFTLYRKAAALYYMKQYDQAESVIAKIGIVSNTSGLTKYPAGIEDKIDMLRHRISINKN